MANTDAEFDTPPVSPQLFKKQLDGASMNHREVKLLRIEKPKKAKKVNPSKASTAPLRRGRPKKPDPITSMTPEEFTNSNKHLKINICENDNDTHGYNPIASIVTSSARENKTGKVGWTYSHKATVMINNSPVYVQISGTIYALRSERWKRSSGNTEQKSDEGVL